MPSLEYSPSQSHENCINTNNLFENFPQNAVGEHESGGSLCSSFIAEYNELSGFIGRFNIIVSKKRPKNMSEIWKTGDLEAFFGGMRYYILLELFYLWYWSYLDDCFNQSLCWMKWFHLSLFYFRLTSLFCFILVHLIGFTLATCNRGTVSTSNIAYPHYAWEKM